MRKCIKLIIGLMLCVLVPIEVKAAMADEIFVCGDATYTILREGQEDMSGAGIYRMNFYGTQNSDGSRAGKTYCLSPGRRAPTQGMSYKCERIINPTDSNPSKATQAFDVAVTKAYQLLVEEGYSSESSRDRYVGELVFRWLSTNFGAGDSGTSYPGAGQALDLFMHQANGDVRPIWLQGNADVQKAREIFLEAARVGNYIWGGSKTFEQLVEEGEIWSDQWNITATINSAAEIPAQHKLYYTIKMQTKGSAPSNIYWDQFSVTCGNGYQCRITSINKISGSEADYIVEIDTTNGKGDYGLKINTAYYDVRSSTANMMILNGSGETYQRMLIVGEGSIKPSIGTGTTGSNGGGGGGGSSHNVFTNACQCEVDASGKYTGNYKYQEYKNGVLQNTITFPITDTNKANQYNCPDASVCTNPPEEEKHVCEIVGDQHYCEDGEPCDEDEYIKDCLCNPVVTIPSDCDDFNTEDVASGYISDIATTGKNCNNSNVVDQIKKCVIGNKDARDESYEATNELSNNPYCKVWCSESYDFDLPTAQYSTSGGYFTLSTSISGKRDCYISSADDPDMPIDEEKFNQDLTAAQHAVIDAYNEFSYWKSAIEAEVNIEERQTNEGTCEESGTDSEGNPITTTRPGAGPRSYTYVWIEWEEVQYNYDGTRKSSNRKGRYTDGSGSCGCSSCDIDNGEVPKSPLIEIDPDNLNIDTDEDGEPDINIDTNGDGTPDLNIDTDEDNICDYKCDTNDDGNCDENCESTGEWNDNYTNAKNTLVEAINNLNTIISQYNSCTGVITNGTNSNLSGVKDASSTADTSWDNDMEFNPTVKFTYNEDYIKSMSGEFDKVSDNESSNYMYCTGDTNDKYECQSGSSSTIPTTAEPVLTCDGEGCSFKYYIISSAKWIRKTKTHNATYRVADRFSTYTQYGTVKVDDDPNTPDYLWTNLPEGAIPVSLIQKTGVFPFKFTFGNIGQSNSIVGENGLGRLIDNETSNSITVDVLSKYNELDSKYKCSGGSNSTTDGGYVCHYLNNCPGCDFTCDDDGNCEFDECEDGHCILECPNCIFDGENSNYSYRTVSLNKLFPNSRDIGYNWSATSKAEQTRKEIEENGETIYEKPQYSYTLTPTNLKNIREYNDKAGSYTNNRTPEVINGDDVAIYCETETINGKQYPVKCKSRFLDLLDNSRNYASNVVRPNPNDNSSWTLYSNTDYCPNGRCITNGLGPAWK